MQPNDLTLSAMSLSYQYSLHANPREIKMDGVAPLPYHKWKKLWQKDEDEEAQKQESSGTQAS